MGTAPTDWTNRPQGVVPERGRLLRVREVAERLNVSKSTAYNLIATGQLPAQQLGGRGYSVRVDELELERFIYEQGEGAAA
jgi:excisionase family DNA binding protein